MNRILEVAYKGITALAAWGPLSRARDSVDGKLMRDVLPRLVQRWSLDVTQPLTSGRLLVIAPHPDDETLGCGATIARNLDVGGEVLVVIATDGEQARRDGDPAAMRTLRLAELARAMEALGLKLTQLRTLGFPDGGLTRHESAVADSIGAILRTWLPDNVLVTAACDLHPDHSALGRAARKAMANSQGALFEYMIWGWLQPTRWLVRAFAIPNGGGRSGKNPSDDYGVDRRYGKSKTRSVGLSSLPTWIIGTPDWIATG